MSAELYIAMLCSRDIFMWKMLIKFNLRITRQWPKPKGGRTENIEYSPSPKEAAGLDLTKKSQLDNVVLLTDEAYNYVVDISLYSNIIQKRNSWPTIT